MIKIENVRIINKSVEISVSNLLTIPSQMLDNAILMAKADKIVSSFNTDDYNLALVEIGGVKYVQSDKVLAFAVETSPDEIKAAIVEDYNKAQAKLNGIQIPDLLLLSQMVYDENGWRD